MHPDDLTLNGFVDETLDRNERADVQRHIDACADCRRLVEELRQIRRDARALPPLEPPAHVWDRIEQEIGRRSGPTQAAAVAPRSIVRRLSMGWLAAAAVLVVAALTGLRLGMFAPRQQPAAAVTTRSADTRELAQSVESELREAESHYQKAIGGLEQITNAENGALDPKTAATLQKNLAVIDQAISESQAAIRAQPASVPAQQSLLDSFKTKIALLEDTVSLINEMRKGNDAGAARAVSGLKQEGE